jgi:hypothetical protein
MTTRLLTGAGCLLLLAAAIAPGALGHDERATSPGTANGVSGAYYGAAGPALVDEDTPIAEHQYGDTIAVGDILCDVEVAGDGIAASPQDEQNIDGEAGGSVPDTNDDGGQGGACHVRTYVREEYNTPGCPSATAYAANVLGDVFLGASCDWKTVTGGTPAGDILLACVANSVLQGQPFDLVPCLTTFLECALDLNPTADCTVGGTEWCGSDGVADGINYGYGNTHYPTSSSDQGSVAYERSPPPRADCEPADSTAQAFVFDAVNADGASGVIPALSGQVWQEAFGGSGTLPECSTVTEDDGGNDGGAFPDDLDCSSPSDDDEGA